MRRVLITGGAGFIGTHLAERLCDDAEVVLLDSFRRDALASVPGLREHPNVSVIRGDVLEPSCLSGAMEGADTVLHLAAIAGVSSYYREPLRTLRVNVLGAVNTLDQAVRAGVKRFVYVSTSEVFGPDALWVSEESGFHIGSSSDKRWVYATSKIAGEHMSLRYGEEHGLPCWVVRPFNVYGPRQVGEGAISNFCAAAVRGEALRVYGDGTAIRAWCYISDLVDAVMAMLVRPETAGQGFNVGNPREVETTLGLARGVARLVPGTEIEFEPTDRVEVRARIPDITKAKKVLGYEPRVDLDEGLTKTLAWFRERTEG
jgi:UDP-glucose 4-epimerase